MRLVPILAACASLALLAACNGETGNDDRTASGQVLEGTISDSMLPLETVRSQPPLAKETAKPGADGEAADAASADATDAPEGEETPAADDDETSADDDDPG